MTIKKHSLLLTGILTGIPWGSALPHAKYVYQKTAKGCGNIEGSRNRREQCRIWVQGTLVNTPAQQPYRARFALGVAAWHLLTPTEKEALRKPAEKIGLNRFQYWMRQWNRTQPVPEFGVWDAGATNWLDSATAWDDGLTGWDDGATYWDGTQTTDWD